MTSPALSPSPPPREVLVVPDPGALAAAAAERFARIAETAVACAGRFTVVLAGGSTPKGLYARLAAEPYRSRIPWGQVHVFWGDERCVPPAHTESNFRMAWETLLQHVPVPPAQIHRMRGEDLDPDRAAAEYEGILRKVFALKAGALPRFDLVLLGMGHDGHTASLFPGSPALREVTRLVAAPSVAHLAAYRLTLTLSVLNEAAAIMFLVAGRDKASMLQRVLEGPERTDLLPAQLIWPRSGTVSWFVDAAASHLLQRSTPKERLA